MNEGFRSPSHKDEIIDAEYENPIVLGHDDPAKLEQQAKLEESENPWSNLDAHLAEEEDSKKKKEAYDSYVNGLHDSIRTTKEEESADEEEEKSDATRKENLEKLKEVVEAVESQNADGSKNEASAEDYEKFFTKRSSEQNAEAKKLGGVEGWFRKLGEDYNKRSLMTKMAVGISLGISAGVLSTVSMPMAVMCLSGIAIQRTAGFASSFMRYEKSSQSKWGALGKTIGYQAAVMAGMAGLFWGVREGIEHHWGDATSEWLKQHWPFGNHTAPEAPTTDVGGGVHEVVNVEVPTPEMPTITLEAEAEHGYEYMVKRLWEQMHEQNVALPSPADPDSDFGRLFEATPETIDKVVHDIASNPDHGFFNADGTSVQINLGDHISIGESGQIELNGAVHSTADAHFTSVYAPEVHAEAPEALPTHSSQEELDALQRKAEEAKLDSASSDLSDIKPKVVTLPTIEEPANYHTVPTATVSTEAYPLTPAEQIPVTYVENHFGIHVQMNEPHIYSSSDGKDLFVYGGSIDDQARAIDSYLKENPEKAVYGASNDGVDRIRYSLGAEGTKNAEQVMKESFWARFFSGNAFMSAPQPDELEQLIK